MPTRADRRRARSSGSALPLTVPLLGVTGRSAQARGTLVPALPGGAVRREPQASWDEAPSRKGVQPCRCLVWGLLLEPVRPALGCHLSASARAACEAQDPREWSEHTAWMGGDIASLSPWRGAEGEAQAGERGKAPGHPAREQQAALPAELHVSRCGTLHGSAGSRGAAAAPSLPQLLVALAWGRQPREHGRDGGPAGAMGQNMSGGHFPARGAACEVGVLSCPCPVSIIHPPQTEVIPMSWGRQCHLVPPVPLHPLPSHRGGPGCLSSPPALPVPA